jgi:hypothetical protein
MCSKTFGVRQLAAALGGEHRNGLSAAVGNLPLEREKGTLAA